MKSVVKRDRKPAWIEWKKVTLNLNNLKYLKIDVYNKSSRILLIDVYVQ